MRLSFLPLTLVLFLAGCAQPETGTKEPTPTPVGSLSGKVFLPGGTVPAEGVEVWILNTGHTFSAADGTYSLAGVPAKNLYTLRFSKAGYALQTVSTPVTALSDTVVNTTLTALPAETGFTLSESNAGLSWGSSSLASITGARTVDVSYTVPAGGADLFYLLTNTNTTTMSSNLAGAGAASVSPFPGSPERLIPNLGAHEVLRQKAAAAFRASRTSPSSRALAGSPVPSPLKAGATTSFHDAYYETNYSSTLRKVINHDGHTLNVWVSDAAWDEEGDGTPATSSQGLSHGVSQAMVDALAEKFLSSTTTEDIYHWVTGVYGAEWPSSGAPTGWDGTAIAGGGQVHIFLANLNPNGTTNGVLMGYFYSVNNFLKTTSGASDSNEKILFALDASSLANPADKNGGDETWALSDYWPAEIVSTLAHEFQHMIHFYEKQILQNVDYSDTWIDEMSSMVTEDFVADKLGVPGPRGVIGMDVGESGNETGRMPLFNYRHEEIPLTAWNNNDPLPNYSSAYAFGAWLLRNHGGPALFHQLVTSEYTDYTAVVNAVKDISDANATWATLMRDWGVATFLGQGGNTSKVNYQAPNGLAFTWNYGGYDYNAGSIDPWRYHMYNDPLDQIPNGPWVYSGAMDSNRKVAAGATYFHWAGEEDAGDHTVTISLPANVVLTVVMVPVEP